MQAFVLPICVVLTADQAEVGCTPSRTKLLLLSHRRSLHKQCQLLVNLCAIDSTNVLQDMAAHIASPSKSSKAGSLDVADVAVGGNILSEMLNAAAKQHGDGISGSSVCSVYQGDAS